MIEISPSILSADFTRLGEQVREAVGAGCKRIHIDVMDGQFVPDITIGPLVVQALRPLADQLGALLEVHLMIVDPDRYLADFRTAGADLLWVHEEVCPHLYRTIQRIAELGARTGVAIDPATPLNTLDEILPDLDSVLIMTVEPGFGGQKFIPRTLEKIARLRQTLEDRGLSKVSIAVDGGVHERTIGGVRKAGAQVAVAGSAVFNARASVAANLATLRSAATGG